MNPLHAKTRNAFCHQLFLDQITGAPYSSNIARLQFCLSLC
jgi:hypothetical protein